MHKCHHILSTCVSACSRILNYARSSDCAVVIYIAPRHPPRRIASLLTVLLYYSTTTLRTSSQLFTSLKEIQVPLDTNLTEIQASLNTNLNRYK